MATLSAIGLQHQFVCVDGLCPRQQVFSHIEMFSCLTGTSTKQRIMCITQRQNSVSQVVSLEIATVPSQV